MTCREVGPVAGLVGVGVTGARRQAGVLVAQHRLLTGQDVAVRVAIGVRAPVPEDLVVERADVRLLTAGKLTESTPAEVLVTVGAVVGLAGAARAEPGREDRDALLRPRR